MIFFVRFVLLMTRSLYRAPWNRPPTANVLDVENEDAIRFLAHDLLREPKFEIEDFKFAGEGLPRGP